ncbi:efflux RND transporter permease subunit [Alloalcanivorax xenomutans]|uniref:Efflux RND transporter permease subunit n=1 Tax=Alloalcanivorax xenomutans TaxID=1094342 RepID=A0A9Q3VYI1_9GAMM|nr:efflux RND transporter permease subunit [Alloalcanivorax xenomutans]ARB47697.1 multidrug transporter AcrB [Alloalcanivorax xenomutans]ERS09446.1 multidrug transporter [Alcanivorax sp. PN-3]MCE7507425.1 efflux RND transporter permease subunit [Alloalcanivorax xenomutans]
MILSDVSIKRPVFATVISLLIVVFGISALMKLPVREYPDIDPPEVSVAVEYPGAAPEVIDTQIIQVIEGAIAGVEGVRRIESRSRRGSARTSVEFNLDRDLDVAANDVRDAVSRVLNRLPEEAEAPVIAKTDADARPIMWVTLSSDSLAPQELTDFAERSLVDRFAVLGGVSEVIIGGERRYAMRVWLDRQRMAANDVTVTDIYNALRANNVELPAGRLDSDSRSFTVRADSRLGSVEEFNRMVVHRQGNYLLRLGDVARVALGVENDDTVLRANGQTAIGLGVVRQSKANTVTVSNNVREEIEAVRNNLPDDIRLDVNHDESLFIRASIKEVLVTLAMSVTLVILVIFVFLGNLRATLIPAVTIPVSIVGAFIGLGILGFSINVLTLLALILAIGLVVDDAIVMLENIQRRIDEGESRLVAAFLGARQVAFAVIATTATLVAVFVPISFMGGDVGRLFGEFGFTLAVAVIISSIVALSLAPMLCSRWLHAHTPEQEKQEQNNLLNRALNGLNQAYGTRLAKTLRRPAPIVVISVLICVAAGGVFSQLSRELAPTEDRGVFIVSANAPQGSSTAYASHHIQKVEEKLLPLIEDGLAVRVLSIVGFRGQVERGFSIVRLEPWEGRNRSQQDIVNDIRGEVTTVPGLRVFAVNPPGLGQSGFDQELEVVIGGQDYDSVVGWSETLRAAMAANPNLLSVDTDYEETQPQVEVVIDRDRAADFGISAAEVGQTLQAMFATLTASTYIDRGREYDVLLEAREQDARIPDDINSIYVRTAAGDLVPLSSLVELRTLGAAPELRRLDRLPAVTLSANLAPGYDLGSALDFIERTVQESLPLEARLSYKGVAQEFTEASAAILITFLLALVIVFLVLAAQFESWIHPLIIMLTVPLAIAGAILALRVTGNSLNIYSQIGMVMLVGLMAKNGILIVEFANQLRDQGLAVREAVYQGAILRFRPVLMTGISTIFGAVPLVLATGAGAESRMTIGVVILGGLLFATVLTLFIIPVLYLWLAPYARPADAVAQQLASQMRRETDR